MKKFAFVLLGLFATGMVLAAIAHSANNHGDWIDLIVAAAFAYGAFAAFRKVGRLTPRSASAGRDRPWQR